MIFLNLYFPSHYEELKRFYPRYYWDVREMDAILKAHGGILDSLAENLETVFFNNFIDTMNEAMIRRMEEYLGIALNKSRTLDERRRLLKAYFIGSGHISASMLEEMIRAYTGADVDIYFEPADEEGNNLLVIDIARGDYTNLYMADILELLAKRLPAHIWYRAMLWYQVPGIVIGGGRVRREYTLFHYPLCGTLPDTSTLGRLNAVAVEIDREEQETIFDYLQAAEDGVKAGEAPEIATKGTLRGVSSVVGADVQKAISSYLAAAEANLPAGQVPETVLKGVLQEVSTETDASAQAVSIGYRMCGSGYSAE